MLKKRQKEAERDQRLQSRKEKAAAKRAEKDGNEDEGQGGDDTRTGKRRRSSAKSLMAELTDADPNILKCNFEDLQVPVADTIEPRRIHCG